MCNPEWVHIHISCRYEAIIHKDHDATRVLSLSKWVCNYSYLWNKHQSYYDCSCNEDALTKSGRVGVHFVVKEEWNNDDDHQQDACDVNDCSYVQRVIQTLHFHFACSKCKKHGNNLEEGHVPIDDPHCTLDGLWVTDVHIELSYFSQLLYRQIMRRLG